MKIITSQHLDGYFKYLKLDEKSKLTIEKYMRDVTAFNIFANNCEITKELVMKYKNKLLSDNYALRSINSMIASINSFFDYTGWIDCKVKSLKIQQTIFCSEEKELTKVEYERLCKTAESKNNVRLNLILQTICSTGIRISELQYITAEAVKQGYAQVNCKSKSRKVFMVKDLRKKLMIYMRLRNITNGPVFITKNGNPMNRSNIWREMKALCKCAMVNIEKVFPHNLRHLFARTFYKIEKDIAKLADILGHSSINTTRIYIISTGFEHQRKMENMRLII